MAATMNDRLTTEEDEVIATAATITTKTTINMRQGCKVWALLLMPLGSGGGGGGGGGRGGRLQCPCLPPWYLPPWLV